MNHKVFLSFIFSLLMCACSQDTDYEGEFEKIQGKIMDFSSRTYLNGRDVIWKADDAISVFAKNGYHYRYELTDGANTTNATFQYQSAIQRGGTKPNDNYAIYPFSANHKLNDGHTIDVDLTFWKEQTYTANSFEDDKSFMTGKSGNLSFPFYNSHSLARVKLSSVIPDVYRITSVSFSSETTILNGKATIDMTVERPILVLKEPESPDDASYKTNTLVCNDGVVLTDAPIDFYILMPVSVHDNLKLTVTGTNLLDGSPLDWSKSYSNITFKRSLYEEFNCMLPVIFSGNIESYN